MKMSSDLSFWVGANRIRESQHKIKLSLSVADKNGQPIKV
jgi:hypothetical protein